MEIAGGGGYIEDIYYKHWPRKGARKKADKEKKNMAGFRKVQRGTA